MAEPVMADPAPSGDPEPARPALPPTWRDVLTLPVVAVVLLVGGAGVAGYALLRTPDPPPTEELLPYAPGAAQDGAAPGSGPVATSTTAAPEVVVHAAGAVASPGVHRLPAGSRVEDLLAAAGGPAVDADLDRVNLAAPVGDGQRVWIPRIGEAAPPEVAADAAAGTDVAGDAAGPVDLNTATAGELDTLPGIGPATAAAILEHRARNGPFRAVDDLLDVPGIGDAKLAQLRDLVTV